MNAPVTNQISPHQLRPGTAIRTSSTRFPLIQHWGMVGYGRDYEGLPVVWHSQKSDTLRCTSYNEFCGGQSCEIVWVPANGQQASRAISRLQSKEGLPWHLTEANCEMVIRWAIEDKPVSGQLAMGFALILFALGVGLVASKTA